MWTYNEWTAFGTVLYGLGTFAGAGAIVVAACFGANTYNRWRRQKLSERKQEEAERILRATYNVRRALSRVRNPMLWAYELSNAEKALKNQNLPLGLDEQKNKQVTLKLYLLRLESETVNREEFEKSLPMARALFGADLERAMEELLQQFQLVFASASAQSNFNENTELDFRNRIERSLWEGYPTAVENEVDQKIERTVRVIEDKCLPVLRE